MSGRQFWQEAIIVSAIKWPDEESMEGQEEICRWLVI
jgi:hypothetical protein